MIAVRSATSSPLARSRDTMLGLMPKPPSRPPPPPDVPPAPETLPSPVSELEPKTGQRRIPTPSTRPVRIEDLRNARGRSSHIILTPPPPSYPAPLAQHHTLGPEEETNVPCPVCRQGMVPPAIAAAASRALKRDSEAPSPPPSSQPASEATSEVPPSSRPPDAAE